MNNEEKIKQIKIDFEEFGEIVDYTNFDPEERDVIYKISNYIKEYIELLLQKTSQVSMLDFDIDEDWNDYGRFTLTITIGASDEDDNIIKTELKEYIRSEFSYGIKEKNDVAYLTFEDGESGTIFGKPLSVIFEDIQNYKLVYTPNKFDKNIKMTNFIIHFDGRHTFLEEDFEDE